MKCRSQAAALELRRLRYGFAGAVCGAAVEAGDVGAADGSVDGAVLTAPGLLVLGADPGIAMLTFGGAGLGTVIFTFGGADG